MNLELIQLQILSIGLLIVSAYLCGKLAGRLNIGEVIGQIAGGILVSPHTLKLIIKITGGSSNEYISKINTFFQSSLLNYKNLFDSYSFFIFLFLALIAFSIGEELHFTRIKQLKKSIFYISMSQVFTTFIVTTSVFYFIFSFTLINSLLIGSIAVGTAPAITFIIMGKLKIEGKLRNLIANIIVITDITEVILFSIFLEFAVTFSKGTEFSILFAMGSTTLKLLLAVLLGGAVFAILRIIVKLRKKRHDFYPDSNMSFLSTFLTEHPTPSVEILLMLTGVIAISTAISLYFHIPFLVTAVSAGFFISNFHSHAIFDSLKIRNVMPIFNLFFFAIIGASVKLDSFSSESLLLMTGYILARGITKPLTVYFVSKVTNQDPKITACIPKLMLPQAGMAAVETILVSALLAGHGGEKIFNTIIPSIVIFEIFGSWISEKTLMKWKNWITGESEINLLNKDCPNNECIVSLSEILEDRVFAISSNKKEDVIDILSEYMVKEGVVPEKDIVYFPAIERENLASTGIGQGIAVPHCRTSLVEKTKVICGVLENPIDWESPDKLPVHIVFFILTPDKNPEDHLLAIQAIVNTISQTDFVKDIRKAMAQGKLKTDVIPYKQLLSAKG